MKLKNEWSEASDSLDALVKPLGWVSKAHRNIGMPQRIVLTTTASVPNS